MSFLTGFTGRKTLARPIAWDKKQSLMINYKISCGPKLSELGIRDVWMALKDRIEMGSEVNYPRLEGEGFPPSPKGTLNPLFDSSREPIL